MTKQAETKGCEACGGTGDWPLPSGATQPCSRCNGTGVETTGAYLGTLHYPSHGGLTVGAGVAPLTVGECVVPLTVGTTGTTDYIGTDPGFESGVTVTDGRDATIAEQAAEIERLKRELCAAEKEIAHMRESNGRADDYSAKVESKLRAYFAVIRAKDAEITALGLAWKASMATGEAMQAAGIEFRHASTEIPPFAAEEPTP